MRTALLLVLAGCPETAVQTYEQCDVAVALDETEVLPGDTVLATGGPYTEPFDTSIRVGGVAAEVIEVDRADCTLCDECRDAALDCGFCGACPDCAAVCSSCVQTLQFVVPEVEPGTATLVLVNAHGQSPPVDVVVLDAGS